MNPVDAHIWSGNWAWGLPLIVLSLVIHVFGLLYIYVGIIGVMRGGLARRRFVPLFAAMMGVSILLVTILHAIEVEIWAVTYFLLGALPDHNAAMLSSLSAMTTYGHANLYLKADWQLMGALEALNGVLLFGLTTAFLVAMIQKVLPLLRGEINA